MNYASYSSIGTNTFLWMLYSIDLQLFILVFRRRRIMRGGFIFGIKTGWIDWACYIVIINLLRLLSGILFAFSVSSSMSMSPYQWCSKVCDEPFKVYHYYLSVCFASSSLNCFWEWVKLCDRFGVWDNVFLAQIHIPNS